MFLNGGAASFQRLMLIYMLLRYLVKVSKYRGNSGCWNRGVPLYKEVSSFRVLGSTVYRGVLISGCWNRGVPLCPFQGVGIEEFHCIQRCPHFRVLE